MLARPSVPITLADMTRSALLRPLAVALLTTLTAALPAQTFPFPIPGIERRATATAKDREKAEADKEQIQAWVGDLGHDHRLRVESAVRGLIGAGEAGAEAVRRLCEHADPVLALRARQVFGAVHGASPEVHQEVQRAIARAAAEPWSTAPIADGLRLLGPSASTAAIRLLKKDKAAPALLAELTVREALDALHEGSDRNDKHRSAVLELAGAATDPLWRAARDGKLDAGRRLHALWLYGVVGPADRATTLADLVGDRDAAVRTEARSLLCDALRPADFGAVAEKSQHWPQSERLQVARTAARALPQKDLLVALGEHAEAAAVLAALALGSERSEAARTALIERLDQEPPAVVGEAVASALGEFSDPKAHEALVRAYAKATATSVRAAAVAALRPRTAERSVRTALCAALFDQDAGVRLLAAEALGSSQDKATTPALILAAEQDKSDALRAHIEATLRRLLPEQTADLGSSQSWRRWLDRQERDLHKEALPWFRASREAATVVELVRDRIAREFFHFGKHDLVDPKKLDKVAREAMQKALGDLQATGEEKLLLERLLQHAPQDKPEDLLRALGAVPFSTAVADLVRLCNASANAMVEHLGDPYSRLAASNDAEGKPRPEWLPGILEDDTNNGFMVKKDGDRFLVDFVMYDSPAFWAGIQRGDQMLKIGDTFVQDVPQKDLRKKLQEKATFSILREGWTRPYDFALEPDQSQHRRMVTKAMLPGGIGYVRLKMFEAGCSSKIEQAIAELEKQDLKALILDLRNNPGGTVIDATAICDLFLPEGKVITVNETRVWTGPDPKDKDLDKTDKQTVKSTRKGKDRTYPVAVLINECSASASEMTSGSLQGNGRAVVVGQTSFGKGIGQSGAGIPGFSSETGLGRTQSQYVLSLTMMRYYVPPDDRSIHGTGVPPDIAVRERNLKGSAFDKLMRAAEHPALREYVEKLRNEHADLCLELCRFDGGDLRYPDFDALHKKLSRHVDADELRRLLRERLRLDILRNADEERFAALQCDVQDDRTLRAAIRELCQRATVDPSKIPEYDGL